MLVVMSGVGKLPLFRYTYQREPVKYVGPRPGYVDGHSLGRLFLCGLVIFRWRLSEGPSLSAYHFFLHRPGLKQYVERLPNLPYKNLARIGRFLEVGCGAGRLLGAITTKYSAKGVGIDQYEPALQVGRLSDISKKLEFYHLKIERGDEVSRAFDEIFSIVFFASALTHITRQNDCRPRLLRELMRQSRYIIAHEKYSSELYEDLKTVGIEPDIEDGVLTFVWKRADD